MEDECVRSYASLSPVPDWYDLFHVNVLAYYKKLENDVLVLRSEESFFMACEFFLERSELLEIVFGSTLYYVDIPQPVEESIFDEVIRLARSMAIDDGNNVVHCQVLPMTVAIVISENEEEMSARTLRDSRVDEAFPLLPEMHYKAVGEWAISQVKWLLSPVRLNHDVLFAWTLFWWGIACRALISIMDSGHCIYRWLRKSNSCPLCRFAMLRN